MVVGRHINYQRINIKIIMDLSALQMEKLADLLRAPEPEVLQGEDFPATSIFLFFFHLSNEPSLK